MLFLPQNNTMIHIVSNFIIIHTLHVASKCYNFTSSTTFPFRSSSLYFLALLGVLSSEVSPSDVLRNRKRLPYILSISFPRDGQPNLPDRIWYTFSGNKSDHIHLPPKLKMSGGTPPLSLIPTRCAERQICFSTHYFLTQV